MKAFRPFLAIALFQSASFVGEALEARLSKVRREGRGRRTTGEAEFFAIGGKAH